VTVAEITAPDLFEKAIIGSLLSVNADNAKSIAFDANPILFSTPQNLHAYKILRQAAIEGSPLRSKTAVAAIENSPGVLEHYGDHDGAVEAHLKNCIEAADPPESYPSFVKQLKLAHTKRILQGAIDKAQIESFMAPTPEEATSICVSNVITAASSLRILTTQTEFEISELRGEFFDSYTMGAEPIRFQQDRLNTVGGFRPGNIVFFGAKTALGKSWWALDVALEAALQGKRVRYYTLEMTRLEVIERLVAMMDAQQTFTLEDVIQRKVPTATIQNYYSMIENLPITIIDGGRSPEQISTDTLACGEDVDIIIVDHFHLLQFSGKDYRIAVNNALNEFKSFAVENQVAMLMLAQLSRPENRGESRKPTIYDLRESGAIEQIADFVILLHKNVEKMGITSREYYTMWTGKQRNGLPAGEFEVNFKGYRFR